MLVQSKFDALMLLLLWFWIEDVTSEDEHIIMTSYLSKLAGGKNWLGGLVTQIDRQGNRAQKGLDDELYDTVQSPERASPGLVFSLQKNCAWQLFSPITVHLWRLRC